MAGWLVGLCVDPTPTAHPPVAAAHCCRRDVLRASARQEFEAARCEADPEIVNRLLVVGRDAVHRVAERGLDKRQQIADGAAAAAAGGGAGALGGGGSRPGQAPGRPFGD